MVVETCHYGHTDCGRGPCKRDAIERPVILCVVLVFLIVFLIVFLGW